MISFQVVPGSWMDDVSAPCQMMTFWLASGVCPCSLLQKRAWNEDVGVVNWWKALSSFLWIWHWQIAARMLFSSVIIYFMKWGLNSWTLRAKEKKYKTKNDLLRRTLCITRDLNYLNWIFCTVFLWVKQKHPLKGWHGTLHGLVLQLCKSLAHGGLAVLPDWLWWFLLPPSPHLCVQSSIFF